MRGVIVFVAAAVLAGPAAADTKAGVDAWQRGDYRTAVDQWRAAAATGDTDAEFNLGQAYKLGRGVPLDTQQAEQWYQRAAAKGHVEAADNYGLALFQNGKPKLAVPYLEKSVARGEPRASYILGTMLFNGIDVPKDWPRAYALMTIAQAAGLPQAAQTMTTLDGYLSPAQKEEGRAEAHRLAEASAAARAGGQLAASRSPGAPPTGTYAAPGLTPPGPSVRVPLPAPSAAARPLSSLAKESGSAPAPAQLAKAPPKPRPVAPTGRWKLQLGAFGDAGNARKLGGQVAGRFGGRSVSYVKAGALTRVLVGPFATRAEAQAACGSLQPCVPVGP